MNAQTAIDIAELCATSAYALFLDRYKERWEPDWTWLEVVTGTSMCLMSAAVRTRSEDAPDWRTYERNVWRAFVLGGAPVIAWRIIRALTMRDEALRYERAKHEYSTKAVAQERESREGSR